jgi:hypothetical protein
MGGDAEAMSGRERLAGTQIGDPARVLEDHFAIASDRQGDAGLAEQISLKIYPVGGVNERVREPVRHRATPFLNPVDPILGLGPSWAIPRGRGPGECSKIKLFGPSRAFVLILSVCPLRFAAPQYISESRRLVAVCPPWAFPP